MSDERRTEQGAPLRLEVEKVLDRLRADESSPSRLTLPDGARLAMRVSAVKTNGELGASLGVVHITRSGVTVDAGITTAIARGRHVRTEGQLTITF